MDTYTWQPWVRARPDRLPRRSHRHTIHFPNRRWHIIALLGATLLRRGPLGLPRIPTRFRIPPRRRSTRSNQAVNRGNGLRNEMEKHTSPPPPPRKLQPPCWKKSYGLSLIVFMMGPQFKLTGPSLGGMSTELGNITTRGDQHSHKYDLEKTTHSSQFLTSSS